MSSPKSPSDLNSRFRTGLQITFQSVLFLFCKSRLTQNYLPSHPPPRHLDIYFPSLLTKPFQWSQFSKTSSSLLSINCSLSLFLIFNQNLTNNNGTASPPHGESGASALSLFHSSPRLRRRIFHPFFPPPYSPPPSPFFFLLQQAATFDYPQVPPPLTSLARPTPSRALHSISISFSPVQHGVQPSLSQSYCHVSSPALSRYFVFRVFVLIYSLFYASC